MSKSVTFSGKPSQLEPCLTYARVHLLANGTTAPSEKAGFLASLLRGPALNWLTQHLKTNETSLEDYDELVEQLRAAFGVDEDALRLQAAKALTGLHQKGSVRDYALKFNQLADEAGLNDQTKTALFTKGLKPKVREGLIFSDTSEDSYDDIIKEAARIDSQLYYSQRHSKQARNDGKQRRGKDGRFKPNNVKSESTW